MVAHGCHSLEEECPKCPYLVEKVCMCGKKTVKNQPCFRAQAGAVSCGMACGALMPCGFHRCKASWYISVLMSILIVVIVILLKVSGALKNVENHVNHVDTLVNFNGIILAFRLLIYSHSPSACDESTPCQAKVTVRCDCGLHKQEITCLATSREQSRGLKNLSCTDLCARMERNRKLAEALDIDTTASFHEPENVKGGYQLRTLDYFNNNRTWCTEIEGVFRDFLSSKSMRHAFKPMTGHKREFVHDLAEAYGLDSDSIDHEPYRRYSPKQ